MKKVGGILAVLLVLGLVAGDAPEPPVPSIGEIMTKLNKKNGLTGKLGKALKKESPNWEEVQKDTAEFVTFAEALGKNTPPKGDAADWAKVTMEYAATAKAMNEAAGKMDKAAALAAQETLAGACKACHMAHK